MYLTFGGTDDSNVLQQDLDKLMVWESRWDMEFNPSKCQVVRVTTSRKSVHFPYKLHGCVLEAVTSARYLGVDISSGLSWNSHIDNITAKANSTLEFIKRNIKTKKRRIRETYCLQHTCMLQAGVCSPYLGSPHQKKHTPAGKDST